MKINPDMMGEICGEMDHNFCSLPGRCALCGGELGQYEKQFKYPDHAQRSVCVEVLQNTLKGLRDNDNTLSNMVGLLSKYVTPEQFEECDNEACRSTEELRRFLDAKTYSDNNKEEK